MTQQIQYPQGVQPTQSQFPTQSSPYGSQSTMGGFQERSMGQPYGQQPTQFGQQPYGGQQAQMGTQFGATQTAGQQFTDAVPQDVQSAISDLDALETVALWTKSQAERRGNHHVAGRCDDLVDLAHVQKNFILRQSPSADVVGQSTRGTIEQIVQELGQQQHVDPGVGEVITRAQQALSSTTQALGNIQVWGQGGQFQR